MHLNLGRFAQVIVWRAWRGFRWHRWPGGLARIYRGSLILGWIEVRIMALKFSGGRMSDWQPIATAPMDGTAVLLYGPRQGGAWGVVEGAWNRGGAMHMPHWMGGIYRPTHWMPLPAPPAVEDAPSDPARIREDEP